MFKFKSMGKKLSAVVLSAVMAVSAMAITGTASAATVDSYDKVTSVTFNIHKSEVDETTAADDSEDKIGNTAGLTGTTQDAPDNYKGLKDANFAMYKVGDINETFEEYDTNDEKIAEAWRVVKSRNIQAIELNPTDKNGLTSVTLNRSQFGLYLVTEVTPVPDAVTTTAQDFLVYLPMTAQNGSNQGEAWLTQVDVYPKNLVTLGGAVLTKTINTAAYDETALEQQPQFKLVEVKEDKTEVVIAENITLGNNFSAIPLTSTAQSDSRYVTVTIGQKAGVIAVDGLPVGNYQFVETRAGRLTGDTKDLAMDVTPRSFSVERGNNVDVISGNTDDFGTYTGNARGLTVELSNDNSRTPEIKKEVQKRDGSWTEGDGGTWSIDIEDVRWKVTSDIPADMETYVKYTITDVIDERLDFELTDESVVVDENLGLIKDADYTISYDEETRTLTVDVTKSGCQKLGAFEYKSKDFSFEFITTINDNAVVDEYIDNQAKLNYENSYKITGEELTEEPKVRTGGLNILKVDSDTNEPLQGVEFVLKDYQGNEVPVRKDSDGFYTVDEDSDSSTVVTNADGKVFIKGLHYTQGDASVFVEDGKNRYTLTETKTNNGYQLLTAPFEIIVTEGTYDVDSSVTIKNAPQPALPMTGGAGTAMFIIIGTLAIAAGAFFFIKSKKKIEE